MVWRLSSEQRVIGSIPQSSVLGPILFFVYINDIYNAASCSVNNVNVKLFSDYIKYYSFIDNVSSVDALQSMINNDARWATIWQLM